MGGANPACASRTLEPARRTKASHNLERNPFFGEEGPRTTTEGVNILMKKKSSTSFANKGFHEPFLPTTSTLAMTTLCVPSVVLRCMRRCGVAPDTTNGKTRQQALPETPHRESRELLAKPSHKILCKTHST